MTPGPLATISVGPVVDDAAGRYSVFAKGAFPRNKNLDGMKIASIAPMDVTEAPEVLSELGAEVIPIGIKPDGLNINDGCAPCIQKTARAVLESGASAGIASMVMRPLHYGR